MIIKSDVEKNLATPFLRDVEAYAIDHKFQTQEFLLTREPVDGSLPGTGGILADLLIGFDPLNIE